MRSPMGEGARRGRGPSTLTVAERRERVTVGGLARCATGETAEFGGGCGGLRRP